MQGSTAKNHKTQSSLVLDVPYHKQIDRFSCAAAVLQMALEYLGISTSQQQLKIQLHVVEDAGPIGGTQEEDLITTAQSYGASVETHEAGTLADILDALHHGHPVIVNFIEQKDQEGHFGLIMGWKNQQLMMHDPLYGPAQALNPTTFMNNWKSESGKTKQWMMVVFPHRS